VAHDLHLKFKSTQVWPTRAYPRGEMAFSVQATDQLNGWQKDSIGEQFSWLKCQSPLVGPARKRLSTWPSPRSATRTCGEASPTRRAATTARAWSTS